MYKTSKWTVIKRKGKKIRIFHSILGNLTNINEDTLKIIMFLKKPHTEEDIIAKFNLDAKDKNALNELKKRHFIVDSSLNEDFSNKAFLKECSHFNEATLRFYLTERCNFSCGYCFEGEDRKVHGKILDLKTAQNGVDAFVEFYKNLSDKPEVIKVYFFGGEPLLNWDIVPKIVDDVNKKIKTMGPKVIIGITTNAVLLTEKIAKYLYDNRIIVYVSLDGVGKDHDIMRKYTDDRGTFKDVERGIKNLIKVSDEKYLKEGIGITSTIGPYNMSGVPKLLKYVKKMGIKNISINKIAPCGGITPETQKKLLINDNNFFEKTKLWYELSEKLEISIGGMWGEIRNRLLNGGLVFCSAAGYEFGVAPDGIVYPCPFVFGNKNYSIGKINKEGSFNLNKEMYRKWHERIPSVMKECKECEIIGVCRGGCLGMALFSKGDIYEPFGCDYAKKFVDYFIWKLPR
jgi:uncharacterized protein